MDTINNELKKEFDMLANEIATSSVKIKDVHNEFRDLFDKGKLDTEILALEEFCNMKGWSKEVKTKISGRIIRLFPNNHMKILLALIFFYL